MNGLISTIQQILNLFNFLSVCIIYIMIPFYQGNRGYLPLHDPVAMQQRLRQGRVDVMQQGVEIWGMLGTVGALTAAAIRALISYGETPQQSRFIAIEEGLTKKGRPKKETIRIEFGEIDLTPEDIREFIRIEASELEALGRDIEERLSKGQKATKLNRNYTERMERLGNVRNNIIEGYEGYIKKVLDMARAGPPEENPLGSVVSNEEVKAFLTAEYFAIQDARKAAEQMEDSPKRDNLLDQIRRADEFRQAIKKREINPTEHTEQIRMRLKELLPEYQLPSAEFLEEQERSKHELASAMQGRFRGRQTKPIDPFETSSEAGFTEIGLDEVVGNALTAETIGAYAGYTDRFSQIQRNKDQLWLNSLPDEYMDRVNGQMLDLMGRPMVSPSLDRIRNGGLLPGIDNKVAYDSAGNVLGIPQKRLLVSNGGDFDIKGSLGGEREQFGYLPDYRRTQY